MTYVLFGLIILALIHFIYSGILLPSIRYSLRLRLFGLRDELRNLKIANEVDLSDQVFIYIQESLNNTINILPRIDMPTIKLAEREIKDHQAITQEVNRRIRLIEECSVEEVKEIYIEIFKIFRVAFFANTGPWFAYLIPAVIVAFPFRKLAQAIQTIVAVPENQIEFVLPFDPMESISIWETRGNHKQRPNAA